MVMLANWPVSARSAVNRKYSALVRRPYEDREGQAWDASFASRREMRPGTRRFGGPPTGCLAALRADLVSLPRQW